MSTDMVLMAWPALSPCAQVVILQVMTVCQKNSLVALDPCWVATHCPLTTEFLDILNNGTVWLRPLPLLLFSPSSLASLEPIRLIDDKYSRREEYRGFTQEFKEKESYRPDVKIEYVDESGRKLTPKEVLRHFLDRMMSCSFSLNVAISCLWTL